MKKLISLLLVCVLALAPLGSLAAQKIPSLPKTLTLTAGQFQLFSQGFTGVWESSDPTVAGAEIDVNEKKNVRLIGFSQGEATLTLTGTRTNKTAQVHVTVLADETAADPVPEAVQRAVDIAVAEWQEVNGQALSKDKRGNKYVKWWGYDNIGWCGAFAGYCLDTAGIPLEKEDNIRKLKPLNSGEPHGIRAAGVPKIDTGYTNLGRATKIPRPGYLVIYGSVKDAYGYKHVGVVTDVTDLGEGLYKVTTVEGNMGSTVKSYCYLYDARNVNHENLSPVPPEEQTEANVNYTPHQNTWYVTEFCATWY